MLQLDSQLLLGHTEESPLLNLSVLLDMAVIQAGTAAPVIEPFVPRAFKTVCVVGVCVCVVCVVYVCSM